MAKCLFLAITVLLSQMNSFGQNKQIDSLQKVVNHSKNDTNKVILLNKISREIKRSDPSKAIDFASQAFNLADKLNYQKGRSSAIINTANVFFYQGKYVNAETEYFKAYELNKKAKYRSGMAGALVGIGLVNMYQSKYPAALRYFFNALKIKEDIKDKAGMSLCYSNIGELYRYQEQYNLSLKYALLSLKIDEEMGEKEGLGDSYHNVAGIYFYINKIDTAMLYEEKALKIRIELGDMRGQSQTYNNLGLMSVEKNDLNKAINYFNQSIILKEKVGDKNGLSHSNRNIAITLLKQNKHQEALVYVQRALAIANEIGAKDCRRDALESYSEILEKLADYKNALSYHKDYSNTKDSIYSKENSVQIAEMQTKYETEKKEQQIQLLNKDKEIQTAISDAKNRKKNIIISSIVIGLLIVIIFASYLFRALRVLRKQKHIIELQKGAVEHQKKIIEEKHKEITDSINYAERIQRALLASKKILDEHLNNYFILFKPKDVVSGDFYWAIQLSNNNFVLVTADSTGHGVPGAIMSILNVACLDKAVTKGITSPDLILNETRQLVIESLKNDGSQDGGKDGMDASLLSFDFKNNILYCAAAYNPIWIIRNSELIEIKADHMPIGKHDKDKIPFTLHTINLQKGDVVYSLTDGFPDQFGGANGKKFKSKQLQSLLISIAHEPMETQKQMLNSTFDTWKGTFEQVDDVCLIGVRV